MNSGPAHQGFMAFATQRGLEWDSARVDGAAVILCNERYRVHVRSAPQGAVVLHARISEMPIDHRQADALLLKVMQLAGQGLPHVAEALVLTEDESELCLQRWVAPDADRLAFSNALEAFLHALGDWRRATGEL
ncbi:CesT family type III secretion system chaperone [Variovorax sp. KK3]|uniref:CesT family type III secretion system chaperone n=1 Tax=Variovorax sp. KK3 TaxID=1855728 RepID=UPI00097C5D20|nr:CesT family type III secretion system chaperone [Variovorax sp. KK3]